MHINALYVYSAEYEVPDGPPMTWLADYLYKKIGTWQQNQNERKMLRTCGVSQFIRDPRGAHHPIIRLTKPTF